MDPLFISKPKAFSLSLLPGARGCYQQIKLSMLDGCGHQSGDGSLAVGFYLAALAIGSSLARTKRLGGCH